jgi:isopentenyldiphosphate isomerase
MSYLERIMDCNRWNADRFLPFVVDGRRMGWIRDDNADLLRRWPDCFSVIAGHIELHQNLHGFEQRTGAVAEAVRQLAESGATTQLHGEMFPVLEFFGQTPVFEIDRSAISLFGIHAFGQHLNGYVQTGDLMSLWVARRAPDRYAFPGRLDNMVAGGLPHGIGLNENLIKECQEEADMPIELAGKARPVGSVSYQCENNQGVTVGTLFCYDLLLSSTFEPRRNDGEVAGFELLPVDQVAEIVRETEQFKPNCNLVIIDFLIRHGFIGPQDGDYQILKDRLNRGRL